MRNYLTIILTALFISTIPLAAYAALININTADASLLDTLPGIGPSKATAIVDYRTQNGPFATIEDIQNVSGIGPSTFADIQPLITVGDASATDTDTTASSTTPATSSNTTSGSSTYVPPPSTLSLETMGDATAVTRAPLVLSAVAKAKSGSVDANAQISWSFGDGSSAVGSTVQKVYHYPGTYLVEIKAVDGLALATGELIVVAAPAEVRIENVTGEGVTVVNDAQTRLDLSGWRLLAGAYSFRIPDGTIILPGMRVLFPSAITNLPVSLDAQLLYPDSTIAARYEPPVQPLTHATSSEVQQTVEPAPASNHTVAHAVEAVRAPAAASELAAAGATLPATSTQTAPIDPPASSGVGGLLHSPWTLGFLGILAAAGGAFMIL